MSVPRRQTLFYFVARIELLQSLISFETPISDVFLVNLAKM